MEFCPNCGKQVSPNDTFCKNCGHDLKKNNLSQGNQTVQPQENQSSQPAPTRTRRNQPQNNKKRNIILAICGVVVVLAVAFFVINIFKSKKSASTNLTPTQEVATIVSYGNLNYSSNEGWGDAYDNAKNDKLKVKRYSAYDFGQYTATAPKGGALYVLNKHVGYVLTNPDDFTKSNVIFIDDTGNEKTISSADVIKKVNNSYKSSVIDNLAKGITIDEIVHAKPAEKQSEPTEDSDSDSSSSSSSSSSSTTKASGLQWTRSQNDQLAELMDDFGDKMDQDYDQSYTKYDTSSSIHTIAGEDYPEIFKEKTFKLYSDGNDGTKIDIGWDPDLTGKYDWQVFAIYNADIGNPEQHATYLFCYHDGKPYALVDQTTNGDDVMVKQTANKYLLNRFNEIAQ